MPHIPDRFLAALHIQAPEQKTLVNKALPTESTSAQITQHGSDTVTFLISQEKIVFRAVFNKVLEVMMPINVLAISGSLRSKSSNSAILRAASHLTPKTVNIELYNGLGNLPLFNPDLEHNPPASVLDFRAHLKKACGVIIASPEYAHGVTGAIKNGLDWITGSGELMNKPVALLNTSARATIAYAALKETISVMMGRIIDRASIVIPLPNNEMDENSIIADPMLSNRLQAAIVSFVEAIANK